VPNVLLNPTVGGESVIARNKRYEQEEKQRIRDDAGRVKCSPDSDDENDDEIWLKEDPNALLQLQDKLEKVLLDDYGNGKRRMWNEHKKWCQDPFHLDCMVFAEIERNVQARYQNDEFGLPKLALCEDPVSNILELCPILKTTYTNRQQYRDKTGFQYSKRMYNQEKSMYYAHCMLIRYCQVTGAQVPSEIFESAPPNNRQRGRRNKRGGRQ